MEMEDVIQDAQSEGVLWSLAVKTEVMRSLLEAFSKTHFSKELVLQGGSALKFIYGSPRYSVDLDFVLQSAPNELSHFSEIGNLVSSVLGHTIASSMKMVNEKIRTALAHGLCAVLCVGERDRAGADIPSVVSEQVRSALAGVKKGSLKNLIVAYEPVWAISTSADFAEADTSERMFRARLTIEKAIAADFDPAAATKKVRIIYGGSVGTENITVIVGEGHMDGVLVGGASLDAEEFATIVRRATGEKARLG